MMKKVSIIGAGQVGGAAAVRIAESSLARVILIDAVENIAKAKAYDLEDSRYSLKYDARVEGSSDLSLIDNSDIVVVTAGFTRKPGMTREELLTRNAEIVSKVCQGILRFAKDAILIMVTNPLDVMTYLALKATGFPRNRVFGMGSNLDAARFANLISKKVFVSTEHIQAFVIGSHGEKMLPLPRLSTVRGKPLTEILDDAEVKALVDRTQQRGAELISLYNSGSAYIGPSASIYEIVETILTGHSKEIAVSACLEGEYGLKDVTIGVLAKIGANGIEDIIEVDLTAQEKEAFLQSAQAIKDSIKLLKI